MAISLTVNGQTYQYPEVDDEDWGAQATLWAQAITQGTLQLTAGPFPLAAELDFGATYGTKQKYLKSKGSPLADAGFIRMANEELVAWRNAANTANASLRTDSNDHLIFNNGVGDFDISDLGGGDVSGPGSATNTAIARFDGTTGKSITDSPITISDAGALAGISSISMNAAITGVTSITASGALTVNAAATLASLTVNAASVLNSLTVNTSIAAATLNLSGAATVASLLSNAAVNAVSLNISGNAAVTGLSTLTGNVSIGNVFPTVASSKDLGSSSLPFKDLFLDNGSTDAGAVYFNASTTAFLKGSASGNTLSMGGFTEFTPSANNGASLGSASVGWQTLTLATATVNGTPSANTLYTDLMPKAWYQSDGSAGNSVGGRNLIMNSRGGTGQYTYVFRRNMTDTSYAVLATPLTGGTGPGFTCTINIIDASSFRVSVWSTAGTLTNAAHSVLVFGN